MTAEGWWAKVEEFWPEFTNLTEQFHPFYRKSHKYPITAGNAEQACQGIREKIASAAQDEDPIDKLLKAKENRDHTTIMSIFNQVWFGMPESESVRYLPGFFQMCDLLADYPNEFDQEEIS